MFFLKENNFFVFLQKIFQRGVRKERREKTLKIFILKILRSPRTLRLI